MQSLVRLIGPFLHVVFSAGNKQPPPTVPRAPAQPSAFHMKLLENALGTHSATFGRGGGVRAAREGSAVAGQRTRKQPLAQKTKFGPARGTPNPSRDRPGHTSHMHTLLRICTMQNHAVAFVRGWVPTGCTVASHVVTGRGQAAPQRVVALTHSWVGFLPQPRGRGVLFAADLP